LLDWKGNFMNRTLLAAALAVLALPAAAMAQMSMPMPAANPLPPTTGPASEVLRSYSTLKPNVIKAAEKMPEADFKFMPTPDIRTYARIVNHITEAQFRTCGILNGTKDIAKPPADTADKATIVAALKASFDECDKAYAALTDANVSEMLPLGPNKRSRIGLAWGNVSHDNEQYAELSTYLRLKGLVPPTSEK
jgi:hypothetical protein